MTKSKILIIVILMVLISVIFSLNNLRYTKNIIIENLIIKTLNNSVGTFKDHKIAITFNENKSICSTSFLLNTTTCNIKDITISLKNNLTLAPILNIEKSEILISTNIFDFKPTLDSELEIRLSSNNIEPNKNFISSQIILNPSFKNMNTQMEMKLADSTDKILKPLKNLNIRIFLKKSRSIKNEIKFSLTFNLESDYLNFHSKEKGILFLNLGERIVKIELNKVAAKVNNTKYTKYLLPKTDVEIQYERSYIISKNPEVILNSIYNIYISNMEMSGNKKDINRFLLGENGSEKVSIEDFKRKLMPTIVNTKINNVNDTADIFLEFINIIFSGDNKGIFKTKEGLTKSKMIESKIKNLSEKGYNYKDHFKIDKGVCNDIKSCKKQVNN